MGTNRLGSTGDDRFGSPPTLTSVTTEGRWGRALVALTVIAVLAVVSFIGGRAVASRLGGTPSDQLALGGSQVGGAPADSVDSDATPASPAPAGPIPTPVTSTDAAQTLTLRAFDGPTPLIDAETDPDLNNSAGIDTSTLGAPDADVDVDVEAVLADLLVLGPAGATVSVHPGDRPADAIRFTVPGSGRLLVPHLIAPTDDQGRLVVSSSDQVRVTMTGYGLYLPAEQASAGRFVATGSLRIGSLVTATDGRTLDIALADALGPAWSQVGLAVLRVNANVGPTGGSLQVGDADPMPWPGPPTPDLGLAGTELVTVAPGAEGDIDMEYLGGSALTVDLVGYYTNAAAPDSRSGLLVLAPRPELRTVVSEGTDLELDLPSDGTADGAALALSGGVLTIEVANEGSGGSVSFRAGVVPTPPGPAFALAPDQRRNTTEYLAKDPDATPVVSAPEGSVLNIWTIGGYT